MRRNNDHEEEEDPVRVSAYTTRAEKRELEREVRRVAQLEGLSILGMGMLLKRAVRYGMRFDHGSLLQYQYWKTHIQNNGNVLPGLTPPHSRSHPDRSLHQGPAEYP